MYTKNKSLEDLFKKAVNAQINLEISKAIDLYNKILKHEPENTNVLSNLAKALNSRGTLEDAQDVFIKAASLEEKSKEDKSERLLDLAIFYLHLYKLETSIKFGELAYKLNPNSHRVCTTVGDVYRFREMFSDAKKWYERALKIDNKNVNAHQGLGFIFRFNSEFKDAFNYFSQSLKFSHGSVNIVHHIRTATLAKSAGYLDEAKRLCKIILKTKPNTAEDVRAASLACVILSDYEKAFKILCTNGHHFSGIPFKNHKGLTSHDLLQKNLNGIQNVQLHINMNRYKNDKSPIFFVAADEKYLKLYFENLVNDIWKFNPNQRVHIHLMLENDEIIPVLKKQISKRFSFSYEMYTPPDKTGYTIRRFYRMYQLLNSLKCPILMADIDLICSRDISTLFEKLQNSEVGILIREHEAVINQQVLASLFYCKPNDSGLAFLRLAVNYMFELELQNDPTWFIDQMALYAAYNYYANVEKNVNFYKIPENLIIIDYQERRKETMFVHAKGKGKDFKVKEFNLPDTYFT